MAMWKATKTGFVNNTLVHPGDVFEGPEGMDFKWAEPMDGARPVEVKSAAPAADTFAGMQAGPQVRELQGKLSAAEAKAADLEAQLNAALAAAPQTADDSETVKSLKADLKAAQKRIGVLEKDIETKDALIAAKDVEYAEMAQNRDDWKAAYDELKGDVDTDHPDQPG